VFNDLGKAEGVHNRAKENCTSIVKKNHLIQQKVVVPSERGGRATKREFGREKNVYRIHLKSNVSNCLTGGNGGILQNRKKKKELWTAVGIRGLKGTGKLGVQIISLPKNFLDDVTHVGGTRWQMGPTKAGN